MDPAWSGRGWVFCVVFFWGGWGWGGVTKTFGPSSFRGPTSKPILFFRPFLTSIFQNIPQYLTSSAIPAFRGPRAGALGPLDLSLGGRYTPTPPISSSPAGAELCRSCAPPTHQLAWLLQTLAWLLYLNCNCCSHFAYHHVVTQITVSHFVSNIFCFIMKNNTPLHPLWSGLGAPRNPPPPLPSKSIPDLP